MEKLSILVMSTTLVALLYGCVSESETSDANDMTDAAMNGNAAVDAESMEPTDTFPDVQSGMSTQ